MDLVIHLKKLTIIPILMQVAIMAGIMIAAGFTLPYWLRYASIFTGISCRDEMFKIKKVHISLLATLPDPVFGELVPLSCSSFASSSIAFNPAGVQAQPSPRILAIKFADM